MIDTEALRTKVLDLAFHGILISQVQDDRSVDVLYHAVRKKKKALIASKVIKAERNVSNISEDEMPDDIPATWKYIPFEHVIYEIGNKTNQVKESELIPKGKVPAISQSAKFIEGYSDAESKVINNIPLVMFGDHTKNVKYIDFPFVICADGCKFFKTIEINPKYFYFWLRYASNRINNKGYARHYSLLRKQFFPLAPLTEERRIVEVIESCFEVLNEIDELQQQYANNITSLNKKILDLAVRGKLVPQDPNDEPASVLLKKIAEEKQKLIKEGKIKKQKALQAITEDEIPFDIPESWEWVRLENVTKSITDGDHQAPPQTKTGISFLVISNVSSGFMDFSNTRHVPEEYFEKLSADRKPAKGDILFTVTGSYGIPMKVETEQEFCFQRHIALIKPMIEANFLVMLLKSPLVKDQCDRVATGTAQKTVGLGSLRNILVPIPPVNEQIRILETLKHTIPLTESLS